MDRTKTFTGDWLSEVAHPWHQATPTLVEPAETVVERNNLVWAAARGATITLSLLAFSSGVVVSLSYLNLI
jgi:hypothetical protein